MSRLSLHQFSEPVVCDGHILHTLILSAFNASILAICMRMHVHVEL